MTKSILLINRNKVCEIHCQSAILLDKCLKSYKEEIKLDRHLLVE